MRDVKGLQQVEPGMRHLVAAVLTVASMAACDLTENRARFQQAGLLRLTPDDSIDFVAPDTVLLNQSFTISATTIGGSCDIKGPTDVITLVDGTVDFRPYDITEVTDEKDCPLVTQTFSHTGTLTPSAAGFVQITLWGRDWNSAIISRVQTVVVK